MRRHSPEFVPFGKGFALEKRFNIRISASNLPYDVEIWVELEGDRFECVELKAERKPGGPPITSEGIRRLPVQDLVRSAAMEAVYKRKKNPKGTAVILTPTRLRGYKRLAEAGPTEDTLEHVALVYRLAYACNESPTKAVEGSFGLARSTAERWVSKARDLGLIDTPDPRTRRRK